MPEWKVRILPRVASDHAPLFGCNYTIPKQRNAPFMFNSFWLSNDTFLGTISKSWSQPVAALPMLSVMRKLQRLKKVLKGWNVEVYGNVDVKVQRLEEEFSYALAASDNDFENRELVQELKSKEMELIDAINSRSELMKSKLKKRRINEGGKKFQTFPFNIQSDN